MHVNLFRRLSADRSGATAIVLAAIAGMLIAFTSLGVEVVLALDTQRSMQSAADSAAISAANSGTLTGQTFSCGSDCTSAGYAVAEKAGFTSANSDCTDNPTVYVGSPCAGDPAATSSACSDGNCVEALIVKPYVMPLANIVGFANGLTLHGRAVAHINTNTPPCALALDPSDKDTVVVNGGAVVDLQSCGLAVNSTDPAAVETKGTGASLTVSSLSVSGNPGYNTSGGGSINAGDPTASSCSPSNTACDSKAPAALNPYANLPVPTCTGGSNITKSTTSPVPPGCYNSLSLSGCSSTPTQLAGGTYEFSSNSNGAFSVSNGCTLTSNNPVTLIFTSGGSVSISGGTVTLTAQSSGTYSGVLFFGPTTTRTQTFNGGGGMNLTGALVFPKALVSFGGNSGTTNAASPCTTIISWQMSFAGGASLAGGCTNVGVKPILEPAALIE